MGDSYPQTTTNMARAAADPLTSPEILWYLYSANQLKVTEILSKRPSLPPDLLAALMTRPLFSRGGHWLTRDISFEEVCDIVADLQLLNESEIGECSTAIELFDFLVNNYELDNIPPNQLTNLLCNPVASISDFRSRAALYSGYLMPNMLLRDSRFDVSSIIPDFGPLDMVWTTPFGVIGSNPSITPAQLTNIVRVARENNILPSKAYENLNCPIELSATYHTWFLEDYEWSPTILMTLDAKTNERLTVLQGEGPWEDLPLMWKLKMVAE